MIPERIKRFGLVTVFGLTELLADGTPNIGAQEMSGQTARRLDVITDCVMSPRPISTFSPDYHIRMTIRIAGDNTNHEEVMVLSIRPERALHGADYIIRADFTQDTTLTIDGYFGPNSPIPGFIPEDYFFHPNTYYRIGLLLAGETIENATVETTSCPPPRTV